MNNLEENLRQAIDQKVPIWVFNTVFSIIGIVFVFLLSQILDFQKRLTILETKLDIPRPTKKKKINFRRSKNKK